MEKKEIVEVELEQLEDEVLMNYCEDCNLTEYYNEYEQVLVSNL